MALFVTPLFCRWWWSLSRIAMPCCTRDSFGERYFGILLIFTHPTVVFDGKGSLFLSQEGTTQRNVGVVSWHTSRVDKQKKQCASAKKKPRLLRRRREGNRRRGRACHFSHRGWDQITAKDQKLFFVSCSLFFHSVVLHSLDLILRFPLGN